MNARRATAGLALLAATAALAAGCGGGGGSKADKAAIERNWIAFFDVSTPQAKRVTLLQNGPQFASVLRQAAANPLARQLSVTVGKVEVKGSQATVTYTLVFGGNPVLKNAKGTAVLADGTWKVGDASFCNLLALQQVHPPACAAAK